MPQIPLLSGIKATTEFSRVYPLNLEPVAVNTGISKIQLVAADGAVQIGVGPGNDRGGINWNGQCYRVMGTKLCRVELNGVVTQLGDVGAGGPISMDFGFDRLAINSGDRLYYYDGMTVTQVTDIDLGSVIDLIWISGFYMTSDGVSIVVTELSDPYSVLPLKYGSAEEDPDMVTGLIKVRNEAYVIGQNTIQVLQLVGGNGFPFRNSPGASIPYGCVSSTAKCQFLETFAFVGSTRGEALGVYLAGSGTAQKVSTREIDLALAAEVSPASILCESRTYRDESRLYVHLAKETWVFLANASALVGEPVWYRAQSDFDKPYGPRLAVLLNGKFIVAAKDKIGILSNEVATHFGDATAWEFNVGMIYNTGKGAIVKMLELTGLSGQPSNDDSASVFMSMTRDGVAYSVERPILLGKAGDRNKRIVWRPMARFSRYLGIKFRGYDKGRPVIAAVEADIIGLSV